jgi:hypothetical protein
LAFRNFRSPSIRPHACPSLETLAVQRLRMLISPDEWDFKSVNVTCNSLQLTESSPHARYTPAGPVSAVTMYNNGIKWPTRQYYGFTMRLEWLVRELFNAETLTHVSEGVSGSGRLQLACAGASNVQRQRYDENECTLLSHTAEDMMHFLSCQVANYKFNCNPKKQF